jgi:Uma2 family endonuclease
MPEALEKEEEKRHFTYADYLEWEGPERYQLLNGEAFMMSSPTVEHQAISMELSSQFAIFLKGKPCKVFAAPLDVRPFPEENRGDDTVIQPDLLVVCNSSKFSKGSVDGPPDLVIEIVSPSNTQRELFLKFQIYLEAGVREYWVIEPLGKKVQVHVLENGHFISSAYKEEAVIPVTILPPLSIDLKTLWGES